MTIHLINTTCGLVPQYDEDFDEKKKLKPGQFYTAEIKLQRNPLFHRLFFALLNCAWDYLPEAVEKGFRSKEAFRKYLTVVRAITSRSSLPHVVSGWKYPSQSLSTTWMTRSSTTCTSG